MMKLICASWLLLCSVTFGQGLNYDQATKKLTYTNVATKLEHVDVKNCDVSNTVHYGIEAVAISGVHGSFGDVDGRINDVDISECTIDSVCTGILNGPSIGEAVRIAYAENCNFTDNVVSNYYKEGVNVIGNCENINIRRNKVGPLAATSPYGCVASCGICVDAWEVASGVTSLIEISHNLVEGCGAGINLRGERGGHLDQILIYNNVVNTIGNCFQFYGVTSSGGTAGFSSGDRTNVRVLNSTFVGQEHPAGPAAQQAVCYIVEHKQGVTLVDLSKLDGFQFKNNIVARDYDTGLTNGRPLFAIEGFLTNDISTSPHYLDPPSNTEFIEISHNLYWDNGHPPRTDGMHGLVVPSLIGDPGFMTSGIFSVGGASQSCEYGIDPGVSKAFEAGFNLSAVPDDITGVLRPLGSTHDIGAFEVNMN